MTVVLLDLLAEYIVAIAVCRSTGVFMSMYMDTVEGFIYLDDVVTEGRGYD